MVRIGLHQGLQHVRAKFLHATTPHTIRCCASWGQSLRERVTLHVAVCLCSRCSGHESSQGAAHPARQAQHARQQHHPCSSRVHVQVDTSIDMYLCHLAACCSCEAYTVLVMPTNAAAAARYPRPGLTVDTIIVAQPQGTSPPQLLLIKRKFDPFKVRLTHGVDWLRNVDCRLVPPFAVLATFASRSQIAQSALGHCQQVLC